MLFSKQEVFDRVWDWFVVQKNPASVDLQRETGRCRYRDAQGNKCAVGILIPDRKYTPRMEEEGLNYILRTLGLSITDAKTVYYLTELQTIHDTAAYDINNANPTLNPDFTKDMHAGLTKFAENAGLVLPC